MYFDGSLNLDGGGEGVLFISLKGEQLKYVFQILFKVFNNEAEYEALLHGLRLVVSHGIKRLLVYGDSLLVVQQVNKEWNINKDTMDALLTLLRAPIYVSQAHGSCSFSLRVFPQEARRSVVDHGDEISGK